MCDRQFDVCATCRKPYQVFGSGPLNFPMNLYCGHVQCERCINQSLAKQASVTCAICNTIVKFENYPTTTKNEQASNISMHVLITDASVNSCSLDADHLFSVSCNLVGKIVVDKQKKDKCIHKIDGPNTSSTVGEAENRCKECCKQMVTTVCDVCKVNTCKTCFEENHSDIKVSAESPHIKCEFHPERYKLAFCRDCNTYICAACDEETHPDHETCSCETLYKEKVEELKALTRKSQQELSEWKKQRLEITSNTEIQERLKQKSAFKEVRTEVQNYFDQLSSLVENLKREYLIDVDRTEKGLALQIKLFHEERVLGHASCLGTSKIPNASIGYANLCCILDHRIAKLGEDFTAASRTRLVYKADPIVKFNHPPIEKSLPVCKLEFDPTNCVKWISSESAVPDGFQEMPIPDKKLANVSVPSEYDSVQDPASSANVRYVDNDSYFPKMEVTEGYRNQRQRVEKMSFDPNISQYVTITHCVSPMEFYVQLASDETKVKKFNPQYVTTGVFDKIPGFRPGMMVYAPFNGYMCRARVIKDLERRSWNSEVQVLYVDYGNTSNVLKKQLRKMPGYLCKEMDLALRCCLEGWEHKNVNVDSEIRQMFINLITVDWQKFKIRITEIRDEVLIVNLVISDCGEISVNDMLKVLKGQEVPIPFSIHKVHYERNAELEEESTKGEVTHVVSPDEFYVRREDTQLPIIGVNMRKIGFSKKWLRYLVYAPYIGMPVAVEPATINGAWARGEIQSMGQRPLKFRTFTVYLVDQGITKIFPWQKLRKLTERNVLSIPKQVICCSLGGVVPKNNNTRWDEDATKLIIARTKGKTMTIMQMGKSDNGKQYSVVLYETADDNYVCINIALVKEGFAEGVNLHLMTEKIPKKPPSKKGHKTSSEDKATAGVKYVQRKGEESRVAYHPVEIVRYINPSAFYICMTNFKQQFIDLDYEMNTFYRIDPGKEDYSVKNMESGKKYAVLENGKWFRAELKEKLPGDSFEMLLIDHGRIVTVSLSQVRTLPEKFANLKCAALLCHLGGVIPAGGAKWTCTATDAFRECCEHVEQLYLPMGSKKKNGSLEVELWYINKIRGGALDPDIERWESLANYLIESGLAFGERRNVLNESGSDESNAKVSRWLDTFPVSAVEEEEETTSEKKEYEKKEEVDTPTDNFGVSSAESSVPLAEVETKNEEMCWAPPLPLEELTFMCYPTYLDEAFNIYIQVPHLYGDKLKFLTDFMQTRYKESCQHPPDVYWKRGECCVARYCVDKKWYRARVVKTNHQTKKAKVLFVDYGNVEVCEFSDMRKDIMATPIPIMCYKCAVTKIEPVDISHKWSRDLLDNVHQGIVEKHCQVSLLPTNVPGTYEVDRLLIPSVGLDIHTFLVDAGFAKHIARPERRIPMSNANSADSDTEDADIVNIVDEEDDKEEEKEEEDDDEMSYSLEESSDEQLQSHRHTTTEILNTESRCTPSLSNSHLSCSPTQVLENTTDGDEFYDANGSSPDVSFSKVSASRDNDRNDNDDNDSLESDLLQLAKIRNNLIAEMALPAIEDDKYVEVSITAVENVDCIYLHIFTDTKSVMEAIELYTQMEKEMRRCAPFQPPLEDFQIGNVGCASYLEDNLWHRVMIIEEREDSKCKVLYIDFGNRDVIDKGSMRKLKPEWYAPPAQCFKCKLLGIKQKNKKLGNKLAECLMKKGWLAKFKRGDANESDMVELFEEEKKTLAYQPLIESGDLILQQ